MTVSEIREKARGQVGPHCASCSVCDGKACGNQIPGPGAKGSGKTAQRNYAKWQELLLAMDPICENKEADTRFDFFGHTLELPVLAGPLGAMKLHYGTKYDDLEYNSLLVPGCVEAGILAFTGDGTNSRVMESASEVIRDNHGAGIPTVKPWDRVTLEKKFELIRKASPWAVAMDVDASGLPFLKGLTPPAGFKTVEELSEIIAEAGIPFIVKGIMTVKAAEKALEAGAAGIVVSNHGGRVLDAVPSTCEVLPAIAESVKGKMMILVDGGIRSGIDVFRALALGADACLIGRPFANMIYGAGKEGIRCYTEELKAQLSEAMTMCGAHRLCEISGEMVYR